VSGRPAAGVVALLRRHAWPAVALVAVVSTPLWSARFFLGPGIGAYDWWKDLYLLQYLRESVVGFGELPFGLIGVPLRVGLAPSVRSSPRCCSRC